MSRVIRICAKIIIAVVWIPCFVLVFPIALVASLAMNPTLREGWEVACEYATGPIKAIMSS